MISPERIAEIAAIPDDAIDTSDIPEQIPNKLNDEDITLAKRLWAWDPVGCKESMSEDHNDLLVPAFPETEEGWLDFCQWWASEYGAMVSDCVPMDDPEFWAPIMALKEE